MSSQSCEKKVGIPLDVYIREVIRNESHISSQVKRYILNSFDVILCILTRNEHFIKLFHGYTSLSPSQRKMLDQHALSQINRNYQFYASLKCCFLVWEYIQDHLGAPGYDYEDKKEDLHDNDEEVLQQVEKMMIWIRRFG